MFVFLAQEQESEKTCFSESLILTQSRKQQSTIICNAINVSGLLCSPCALLLHCPIDSREFCRERFVISLLVNDCESIFHKMGNEPSRMWLFLYCWMAARNLIRAPDMINCAWSKAFSIEWICENTWKHDLVAQWCGLIKSGWDGGCAQVFCVCSVKL